MWEWGELQVAGMENDRIGAYVLGFGQGEDGELYVMTSQSSAPTGDTGKVWRLVAAPDDDSDEAESSTDATTEPEAPMATETASG
ncbi:MAG: hypothetical protein ABI835_20625 [Chloroflexota bacterium]